MNPPKRLAPRLMSIINTDGKELITLKRRTTDSAGMRQSASKNITMIATCKLA